jgi:hypothetical protein
MFVDFLKPFEARDMDVLSATVNGANSTQNYPNLPKFAQRRNFEIPPKIKILVFLKKLKICVCRGGTRACFHHLDFQSKNFSYAIFIVKRRPLYVNFSIPPCGN